MNYEKFLGCINTLLKEDDIQRVDNAIILISLRNFSTLLTLLPTITCLDVSKAIEEKLHSLLRTSDRLVKLANDEYGILLHNVIDENHVKLAINKINHLLGNKIKVNEKSFILSLQFGITIAKAERKHNPNQLVREAYVALSRSIKSNHEYSIYEMEYDQDQKQKEDLAVELHSAVEKNEFEAYLQPQISLSDNTICSAEILARWTLNNVFISPEIMIPLAEKFGLIKDITTWMFKNCLRIGKDLSNSDINIKLSINISVYDLADPLFSHKVKQLLEIWQVSGEMLTFEITETAMLENNETIRRNIFNFIDLGIDLSIDDFGKGYSSLAYIKDLPISHLKIDRSFISNIVIDDRSKAVAKAIIELGHALNMNVVAEGVEDYPTFHQLKSYGCDSIQGYLISKPVPFDDFVKFMLNDSAELKHLG